MNMTLGNWDPAAEQAKTNLTLDAALVQRLIGISRANQLDQLGDLLSADEQQVYAGLMQLPKESWFGQAQSLGDDEIFDLMRFLTKAEQLPGWEAGANSPVVWLGKVLKQRGTGIPRELVLWIKENSDNRFLPHGPL